MGKAPADQFYWGDWLNDVELQMASASSRGIWINALCRMWGSRTRGEISGTKENLINLLNCKKEEFDLFLFEVQKYGFGEMITQMITEKSVIKNVIRNDLITVDETQMITLRNRRMFRKANANNKAYLRLKKYREKQHDNAIDNATCNANETHASSSSLKEYKEKNNDNASKNPPPPYQKIRELWIKILPELPQPRIENKTWYKPCKARITQYPKAKDIQWWEMFMQTIRTNPHWMGVNDRQWTPDIIWFMQEKNFFKVIEWKHK